MKSNISLLVIVCVVLGLAALAAAEDFGCHKGYCWTKCDGAGNVWTAFHGLEWCWTTKGGSQDFQYVTCNSNADCDRIWNCASSCTV